MLKFFRRSIVRNILSLALCAASLGWFFSPSVQMIRSLPEVTDRISWGGDGLISLSTAGAVPVRGQGDQRLFAVTREQSFTFSLFGLIPLRTVRVVGESDRVRVGGEAVGIVLYLDGVQVVGLGSVETGDGQVSPAARAGLRGGDTITAVDGVRVENAEQFALLCDKDDGPLVFTYQRGNRTFETSVLPVYDAQADCKRVGAWVRDSTSGVGTLSFTDEDGLRYCALGHAVTDVDTGAVLPSRDGLLSWATITEVVRGRSGNPGELVGRFGKTEKEAAGHIQSNSDYGLFGTLDHPKPEPTRAVPVARAAQVQLGEAILLSTVNGREICEYSCNIIRADVQSAPAVQGIIIEVTDKRLLDQVGGIVQGMSGSPVLQNGRLVGVVTHVFVNNPKRGYCIYAEWMCEKLDSLTNFS
ncbi:MAG: SpoIVB peptidase [Clostridiales bacterium]|nr:SpoIVB peptidase [Clostridiales bacterium]